MGPLYGVVIDLDYFFALAFNCRRGEYNLYTVIKIIHAVSDSVEKEHCCGIINKTTDILHPSIIKQTRVSNTKHLFV